MKSLLLLQGCDFRDWEWQSTAADSSGSTPCFPFETPHQRRPRERAPGAQGPGQCETEKYTHTVHTAVLSDEIVLLFHVCVSLLPPVVLGAHHRRGSWWQHGPVSAWPFLRLDTTTCADTRHPGVLWRFKSEAFARSRYQRRSAGA